MKKLISLTLAGVMAFSMIPTAFATNVYENPDQDTEMGTAVEYVADDEANEWWTVTVPALLNPGATGYVVAEGQFASNKTLNVTADTEVELTNSINTNNKKTLGITFASIALPGDNVAEVTNVTEAAPNGEAISVAAIENALFGTWSGEFNYNVELAEVEEAVEPTVMFYDVKYMESPSDATWLMFKENGEIWSGGNAMPDGLKLGTYTTDGQVLKNNMYPGEFSDDGYTFTIVGTALDGTQYIYKP